ncbi:hypothetical protein TNCV_1088311 [Trichonephila clavipes]|uniref:Uncharacterized protein n=1 Tax=Trichonephila clavipes TaxID=2585209 RepID=A0A8X6STB6_TRICX|nr:hypothetical protein TNCV_1088311 [Trichonephila clavipes]
MQPLTPSTVQFTGNIFNIPFHHQLSCLVSPCPLASLRSFVVLISRTGYFVSCNSKMSKRKSLIIKEKNLILQEVDKGVKKRHIVYMKKDVYELWYPGTS